MDVNVDNVDVAENTLRKFSNFSAQIDFKIEYLLSAMIVCLILKVTDIIQYSSDIGPLVKIVGKMLGDFMNFFILYVILVIMFAIVGNLNFIFDLVEFDGLFASCLTVLDASIGNYDFGVFKAIPNNSFLTVFGDFYIMAIVITFNILILNLIIAILSNTYNMFDTKSTGLYLSKILNARDDMEFDENYGAFLLTMVPLNVIILPFVPYAIFKKPSVKMNTFILILQYSVFIVLIYVIFLAGSCIMIPLAYLKSVAMKAQNLMKANELNQKILNGVRLMIFIVFGIPILLINQVSDFYYFWANNFRSNLKLIIIERQRSSLTNESVR